MEEEKIVDSAETLGEYRVIGEKLKYIICRMSNNDKDARKTKKDIKSSMTSNISSS